MFFNYEVLKNPEITRQLISIHADIENGKINYSISEVNELILFSSTLPSKLSFLKIQFVLFSFSFICFLIGGFSFWIYVLFFILVLYFAFEFNQIDKKNKKAIDIITLYRNGQLGKVIIANSQNIASPQIQTNSNEYVSSAIATAFDLKIKNLKELSDLKDQGALTEEEFQAEKKKILSK